MSSINFIARNAEKRVTMGEFAHHMFLIHPWYVQGTLLKSSVDNEKETDMFFYTVKPWYKGSNLVSTRLFASKTISKKYDNPSCQCEGYTHYCKPRYLNIQDYYITKLTPDEHAELENISHLSTRKGRQDFFKDMGF